MSESADERAILLVDDDDDLSFAMKRLLEGAGYRVRCARDGDEGLRMAAEVRPDLMILDLLMPVKDGFTTSAEMRTVAALREVPILALTAFGQDVGEMHGAAGREAVENIQEYLEKPVEPNILLERVAALLAAR